MLQSKGIKVVEPYSLHGMTAADMRALANQYDLRVVGRHGNVGEATWDSEITTAKTLGQEFIGSGGTAAPGQGTYAQTLATAATLNRLGGARSRPAWARSTSTTTRRSSRPSTTSTASSSPRGKS